MKGSNQDSKGKSERIWDLGLTKALSDTQKQLSDIDAAVRQKIHTAYVEQVDMVKPLLREQGNRVGQQLLENLYRFVDKPGDTQRGGKEKPTPSTSGSGSTPVRVAQSRRPGKLTLGESLTSAGTLSKQWLSTIVLNDAVATKVDEVCEMYINPVLDPFVVGLSEPFQEAADQARRQSILAMSLACTASAAIGFTAGMWFSKRVVPSSEDLFYQNWHMILKIRWLPGMT